MDEIEPDYTFKILLTGAKDSGKYSLFTRYADGTFKEGDFFKGINFTIKKLKVNDKSVRL